MNVDALVNPLALAGLVAVMLSTGLSASVDDVLRSLRAPRLVLGSLGANYLLVPAIAILLLRTFEADPMTSLGFLLLAVCPGAPVGPSFAAIARGDVPAAVGQMTILAGSSPLLSPLLLGFAAERLLAAGDVRVDALAIVRTLLLSQLLPLAIGLGIRRRLPTFAERLARPVGRAAALLLLVVVALVLIREREALAGIRLRGWGGMLLLATASLGVGWICGGPGRAIRKSLAVTTCARNAGVALVVATNEYANTTVPVAVVAYGLLSIFVALGCAGLFAAFPEPDG